MINVSIRTHSSVYEPRYIAIISTDSDFFLFQCLTTSGKNELTRVSVVNTKSETIYDSLVKPYNTITNYLTR